MAESTKKFHYGWIVMVAACLIMFMPCCFTFTAASVFYSSVAEAMNVGTGQVGLYMSIVYLTMFVALLFMGKLFDKKDARIVLTFSVVCIALAFFIMSITPVIYGFYGAGILLGLGNAVVLYLMIPVLVGRWFKKNVGLLIGVGMAMTGIGGMLWSPVATSIILSNGYQAAYLMYAILSAVIGIPCALFIIRSRPSDKGLEPFGYDAAAEAAASKAAASTVVEGVSVQVARKQPGALILVALYAGLVNLGLTMNFYLPTYVKTLTIFGGEAEAAMVGATLASVVMFGSLVGKVVLGWTNDRSVPGSVIFGLLSGIIGLLLVLFGANVSVYAVYVGGALFGVFFASATTTTPQLTRKVFGNKDYSQIYSYVTAVCALLAAFGSAIWGFIYDFTGSFFATFAIDMTFMAVCFVLAFAGMAVGKKLPRA